ncbi:MAG TPA: hypothetical protein VN625_07170 [Desulfuromonadaceae bacterium]|nr:hypothetical protein [Desulfuromonadaceae bacterium]
MPEPNPAANQSSTTSPNSTSATRLPSPTAATVATAAFSPPATATAENQNLPAATVMENMRSVIRLYGSQFGGNPVGNNTEITAALTGNNPKQVNFIQPDSGLRLSDKGELVDPWGTPFFFHQLSGTVMEIHSAGPDRKMWTADDVVAK